jgi:uncharacterized membrane protein YccC
MLAKISGWRPLDLDAAYDDLDQVLGEQAPAAEDLGTVSDRLRDLLRQLSNIAYADPVFSPGPEITALVQRGEELRSEEPSRDYGQALGQSRRLALTTSDLIDRLIEERHIKDDDQT